MPDTEGFDQHILDFKICQCDDKLIDPISLERTRKLCEEPVRPDDLCTALNCAGTAKERQCSSRKKRWEVVFSRHFNSANKKMKVPESLAGDRCDTEESVHENAPM